MPSLFVRSLHLASSIIISIVVLYCYSCLLLVTHVKLFVKYPENIAFIITVSSDMAITGIINVFLGIFKMLEVFVTMVCISFVRLEVYLLTE